MTRANPEAPHSAIFYGLHILLTPHFWHKYLIYLPVLQHPQSMTSRSMKDQISGQYRTTELQVIDLTFYIHAFTQQTG
jgi:hypothetical protein